MKKIAIDIDGVLYNCLRKMLELNKEYNITLKDITQYITNDSLRSMNLTDKDIEKFWINFSADTDFYKDDYILDSAHQILSYLDKKYKKDDMFISFYSKTVYSQIQSKCDLISKLLVDYDFNYDIRLCMLDQEKDYDEYDYIYEDNPEVLDKYGHKTILVGHPYNEMYKEKAFKYIDYNKENLNV